MSSPNLPIMPSASAATPIDDPRDRLGHALRQLEAVQAAGRHWAMAEAYRGVAAAYRELDAMPSCLSNLQAALRWARAVAAGDLVVDLNCEAVEAFARLSDLAERDTPGSGRPARDRARDLIFETTASVARTADPQWEVTVLLRLSDVLDRFGDRDDATQLQMRALQLTVGESFSTPPRAADASLLRSH